MGEGGFRVSLDQAADAPVREVGGAEQGYLPQHVQPAVRQDARLQDTSAGDHQPRKPRRCSVAAWSFAEDACEGEADDDVEAAGAACLHLGPPRGCPPDTAAAA